MSNRRRRPHVDDLFDLVLVIDSPLTEALHTYNTEIARRLLTQEQVAESTPATTHPKGPEMTAVANTPDTTTLERTVTALNEAHNYLASAVSQLGTRVGELQETIARQDQELTELKATIEQLPKPRSKPADDTNDRIVAFLRDTVPGVWLNPSAIGQNIGVEGRSVADRLARLAANGKIERKGGMHSGANPVYRVVPLPATQGER